MTSQAEVQERVAGTRKSFYPLESDPELFTQLAHDLGLSPTLAFHDVLSTDDPELLAFIPRPVHALVLCFFVSHVYEKQIDETEAARGDYAGSGEDEPVVWYRQTIYNACGLYGILHAISNGTARAHISKWRDPLRGVHSSEPSFKPIYRTLLTDRN